MRRVKQPTAACSRSAGEGSPVGSRGMQDVDRFGALFVANVLAALIAVATGAGDEAALSAAQADQRNLPDHRRVVEPS